MRGRGREAIGDESRRGWGTTKREENGRSDKFEVNNKK
jgi:hypothetical protein